MVRLLSSRRRTFVFQGQDANAAGTSVQIFDCHSCHIYILAPVRMLEVVGCTNCTVMAGAVARVVTVQHCHRLTLFATAAAVHAHNMSETVLHLCCSTRPLLWGENHRLVLAPFGVVYGSLAKHMKAARISPKLCCNCWDQPICCAASHSTMSSLGGTATDQMEACYSFLPPCAYLLFHVPFDVPADAKPGSIMEQVVELPPPYAESLAQRSKQLSDFSAQLDELQCSHGVKEEVSTALQIRFREWLIRTGNMRQLIDLVGVGPSVSAS